MRLGYPAHTRCHPNAPAGLSNNQQLLGELRPSGVGQKPQRSQRTAGNRNYGSHLKVNHPSQSHEVVKSRISSNNYWLQRLKFLLNLLEKQMTDRSAKYTRIKAKGKQHNKRYRRRACTCTAQQCASTVTCLRRSRPLKEGKMLQF